jgi:hypothetical protein
MAVSCALQHIFRRKYQAASVVSTGEEDGVGRVKIKVAIATINTERAIGTYILSLKSTENPSDTPIKLTEAILAFFEIAPSLNQLSIWCPNRGCVCNQTFRRGELLLNAQTATNKKGVVGKTGKKAPIKPSVVKIPPIAR